MSTASASYTESDDVEEFLGGGSDDAGFVQVTQGRIADREAMAAFEARTTDQLVQARPDLIGGLRVWHDDNRYTEVNYFTSEAEARANEARMGETWATTSRSTWTSSRSTAGST